MSIEKKKITKQLNLKLEQLGIKNKILDSEADSDKSQWHIFCSNIDMNKLLLQEIKIKSELIRVLNELIIEQNNQIDTYWQMINDINDILNDTYIDVWLDL